MQKSLVTGKGEQRDISILSDLKLFEAEQEQKLELARQKAEQEIAAAGEKAAKGIEKIKVAHLKKLENALQKEREKAKKQAGSIFTDFKKKEASLRKSFAKNKGKAVKAVFRELLEGENV